MTDRENVIKEFEHILNEARGDYLDYADITVDFGEKILAMLKEQESEAKWIYGEDKTGVDGWYCSKATLS